MNRTQKRKKFLSPEAGVASGGYATIGFRISANPINAIPTPSPTLNPLPSPTTSTSLTPAPTIGTSISPSPQ
jgi:hypothetical protein